MERLKWFGSVVVGGSLTTCLAWVAVADRLPHWTLYAVPAAVVLVAIATFPYGRAEDGSPQRVFTALVRGRGNAALVSGDSSPMTGNIVNSGSGSPTLTINQGTQLTYTDVRQISIDASRAVVLPEARKAGRVAAMAVIDGRVDVFTDKVVQRANETDPTLFVRWDDPRFLAALTSAQRSYAETGDDDLGDLLANLLVDMAGQSIRSRHEIVLRQAVDVAPRLTTEHVNALVTIMLITRMKLEGVFDTDGLIKALDGLFRPYYGRLPSGEIDYLYMSSTGVCYHDQLHQFAGGVYQRLCDRYPNSMYPAFTFAELRTDFLSDSNPLRDENVTLLGVIAAHPDDVVQTPDGKTLFSAESLERAQFRVEPTSISTILASRNDGVDALSESAKTLRRMVRERSITVDQFQARVTELKPELAGFLDYVQRTGALHYLLHPVGYILAQHAIKEHAPSMAEAVNAAFDSL